MSPNPLGFLVLLLPATVVALMLYPRQYLREPKQHLLPVVGSGYLVTAIIAYFRIGGGGWGAVAVIAHAFSAIWVVQLVVNWLHLSDAPHPIARQAARWRFY